VEAEAEAEAEAETETETETEAEAETETEEETEAEEEPAKVLLGLDHGMTAPISIRAATRADAPALHALLVALAEHEGQRDWLRVSLEALTRDGFGDNPRFGALMAFAGDTAVGYATYTVPYVIWLGAASLNLDDLYVIDAVRGQGVGLALMHALAAEARARGVTALRWEVQPDNHAAIRFYQRLGARLRTKGIFTWEPNLGPDAAGQADGAG
jgi:GNAT superfamily N-acetyltransferase